MGNCGESLYAPGLARAKQHVIRNLVAFIDFSGPLERLLSRLFPIMEEHSLSAALLSLPPRRIMTVQEKHGVTLISTFHRGEPRCTHPWHFLVSLPIDVGRHTGEMTGFVANTVFPSLLYRLPFCPPPGFTFCSRSWTGGHGGEREINRSCSLTNPMFFKLSGLAVLLLIFFFLTEIELCHAFI